MEKHIINSLKAVNDTAERGVKLIEEYNKKLRTKTTCITGNLFYYFKNKLNLKMLLYFLDCARLPEKISAK